MLPANGAGASTHLRENAHSKGRNGRCLRGGGSGVLGFGCHGRVAGDRALSPRRPKLPRQSLRRSCRKLSRILPERGEHKFIAGRSEHHG